MFDYNFSENKPPSALEVHQYAREMKRMRMLSPYKDSSENIHTLPGKSGYLANFIKRFAAILRTPVRRWNAVLGK